MKDIGWAIALLSCLLVGLMLIGKSYETRKFEKAQGSLQWEETHE